MDFYEYATDMIDESLSYREENEKVVIENGHIPYLDKSPFSLFKTRTPWLMLLMVTSTFTGIIISVFENALAAKVVLTIFIPMLMGTGGNCGSQSSVTVIRALSLGEIELNDSLKVLFKELCVSIFCGLFLALFEFAKILTLDRALFGNDVTVAVAITVSLTLLATIVFAKITGALLPLAASRFRLDPAVMASPFITTLVDTAALFIYFSIANTLLL